MADNLLDVMTTSVNGIQDAVKTVGKDVESAIKNLKDDAKASQYIRILRTKLTNEAASILLPRMSEFYEGANLSEDKKKELFESIRDKAMNNPNILNSLSGELKNQVSKMMQEAGMPVEVSTEPTPQLFPYASSTSDGRLSSDGRSTSGSSRDGSTVTRNTTDTRESGVNALRELIGQGRKENGTQNGPQNGPLASPLSASESKGSESQEDIKGPTKSPPSCTAGIKKALSSCCSYLYNGFKSMFKTDIDRFIQRDKEMQSEKAREERNERKAEDEEWKRKGGDVSIQPKTKRAQINARNPSQNSGDSFFSSLRGMWRRDFTYDRFDTTVDMKNGVSNKWKATENVSMEGAYQSVKSTVIRAGTGGVILGLKGVEAARGLPGSLRRGGEVIGELGASAVRFAVTDNGYGSSTPSTWAERFDGMRGLTEGMGSGYGPGRFIRDGANFLSTPGTGDGSLPSGRGVAKSVVRGGAGAVRSMASMVQNAGFTFPTIGRSR